MKKRKPPVAISDMDRWKYGCPYCSYKDSVFLDRKVDPEDRGTEGVFRCKKCGGEFRVFSGKLKVSLIGFKLGGVVHYPWLQMHPRRKKELRKAARKVVHELREEE